MKKPIITKNVRIPCYALPYIINSDSSGLEQSDIDIINKFFRPLECSNTDHYHVSVDSEDYYFTNFPAFGLPCDVTDCSIVVYSK